MDDKLVKEFENNQIELLKTQLSGYDYVCKNINYYKWYLAEIDRDIDEGLYPSTAVKEVIIENKSGQSPQQIVVGMKCEVEQKIKRLQTHKDYIDSIICKLNEDEREIIESRFFAALTYEQLSNKYHKAINGIVYDIDKILKKLIL